MFYTSRVCLVHISFPEGIIKFVPEKETMIALVVTIFFLMLDFAMVAPGHGASEGDLDAS